uniref:Uncharacterized protein n=1 Tax=Anguilla anguilla TaxID=7936 RepID=A0A0E9SP61_ANGAN
MVEATGGEFSSDQWFGKKASERLFSAGGNIVTCQSLL